ncbi:MAG: helix-turn-helix transcriptional regulator [Porticoccaceae bacterium]
MAKKGFSQRQLAEELSVPLARIKNITSGRVQKLAPAEVRALVERLHVRGEYLATGIPPIFKSPGEIELDRRLTAIAISTEVAESVSEYVTRGQVQEQIFRALVESLAPDEQALLQHYRLCSQADREALIALSRRLSAGVTASET